MTPGPPTLDLDVPSIDQLGFVVEDLDASVARYADRLGVGPWAGFHFAPPALANPTYRGEAVDYTMRMAAATFGDVQIELIEPVSGPSSYTEHLEARGEGFQHVACASFEAPRAAVEALHAAGFDLVQSGEFHDGAFWYFDIGEAMDGALFEVVDLPDPRPEPDIRYPAA